jgi:hypothetical protein
MQFWKYGTTKIFDTSSMWELVGLLSEINHPTLISDTDHSNIIQWVWCIYFVPHVTSMKAKTVR